MAADCPMKILTAYIIREFMKPFLLSLLFFCVIILIIQVFNDIRFIMEYKATFFLASKYFALQIPALLMQIVPLAVLFGVLFSLSWLSKNSELIAMRAGGVSIFLVAVPLFFSGLVICAASVLFNETVVPKTTKMKSYTKDVEILKMAEPGANRIRQNISMIGATRQVYHIGVFDGTAQTMTDILVLEFGEGTKLRSRIDAKTAKFEGAEWIFYSGYARSFDETGSETFSQPFDRMPVALPERPGDFLKEQKPPQELNLFELYAHVSQLKRNGSDYHKEMVELHRKIALPFGCVILAILGVPWGWSMKKYSGVVVSFGICVLVAFFYMGGMQIGQQLGHSGVLSPFFSMWIMNILFALGAPVLLIRNNR